MKTPDLDIHRKLKQIMHPDYEALPESIKLRHSPEGYAWLGEERNRVIERECYPDHEVIE